MEDDRIKKLNIVLDKLCEKVIILKNCPSSITEKQLEELHNYGQQCPHLFVADKNIINKLRHLLNTKCSNKSSMNKKMNSPLHITVAVLIYKVFARSSNWPVWIITSFIQDSLTSKLWVDNDATLLFCKNLRLAFDDNEYDSMETDEILDDNEIIQDLVDSNIIMNRYKRIKVKVKNVIIEIVENYLSNGNCNTYVLQTCLHLIKIPEIRTMISKYLDTWIKNPAMSEQCRILAKNLIKHVHIEPNGSVSNSDIVVLDAVIKLKQTMVNQMDVYKVMLKAAVQRSDIVARLIFKSLIIADVGLSNIAETVKIISLLAKEIQSSPNEIIGRAFGEATSEYFRTHGKFTAQSSKIFIDASSKLLRQCYSESFSTLDFGRGFLLGSALSHASVSESTQEFLAFSVDILVTLMHLRFNDSMVESRDSNTRSNTANASKSNFVNIKELSKSTKGSTLLKLSSQVKLGNTTEVVMPKPKAITSITNCDRVLIFRDVMSIQELAISWLSQISSKLKLTNLNEESCSNNIIELVQRACCLVTSPRVSLDVDKKCNFLIKESGGINENIIKAMSTLALNTSSTSLVAIASWLETIETVVHRAIKTQQNSTFSCDIILDDIEGVILSLFTLCTLDIIPSDVKAKPIEPLTDICLVASSIDSDVTNHPYKGCFDKGKRHLISLPLLVDKSTYWAVLRIIYVLACNRPDSVGKFVWEHIPTVKNLMTMTIAGRENLGTSKKTSFIKTCLRHELKKFESKIGDEIFITEKHLQISESSGTQSHHEDLLREFELAVWKHLFGEDVVDNIVDMKEIHRKRDYERWEMEQEKLELKARREIMKDSRSARAALRMAKKEGSPVEDIATAELGIKRKLEAVVDVEIFPPPALSYRTAPYVTQYGIPTQDSVMFMNVKDCPRVPSEDITKSIMNLENKFKLGCKLRSCIDPDFISQSLVDCDEYSMSRDTMWLISAISEDLETVLQRLPLQALCHLLRLVTVKVFDRFHLNIWDFNQVDDQEEVAPFFDNLISRNDDLFTSDEHTNDMKLIAALIFKLQVLFTDYNTNQYSERHTVLSIIMSSFEHEDFNRRCVCRLFLGYFFKVDSKSSSVTYSFDDVTRLGPICCDFMSALKTIYISLHNHNDSDTTIIIDSITNCFKSEGNIKVVRTMLQFLKWLETDYNYILLSTKALLLLLSTKPLTAKHVLSCMSLEEIYHYMQPVINSISSLSNQANNLISQTASTNLLSSHRYESFFIGVSIVDLDFDGIYQRKQQSKVLGNIAVRVDALRSLLTIALLHPNSYNNLNSPLIDCSLSVLASLTIENIKNFFGDIIGLTRTLTNYKYCKIILSILPTEILLKLIKHYSGFTIEFMKAFTDTIDKTIMMGLLTWEQIFKILGVAAFSKLCKESEPLIKCLRYFSSLDTHDSEEGEENEELTCLDLSLGDLKNYVDSSVVLKQVFEYTASNNTVESAMEVDSIFEKNDYNDEELGLIITSMKDYQTLFKLLLKILKRCDPSTLENKLKCLLGRTLICSSLEESSSITTENKITLIEAINSVLVLLKDDDLLTSTSSSLVDEILMKLVLRVNHFFGYDKTMLFLRSYFLNSYIPLKDTASALRFLERVIDIIDENDNNLDGSSMIVIAISILSVIVRSSIPWTSLSLIEIKSFLPKIARLLFIIKFPSGILSWKSIDLPFFHNFIKTNRNFNTFESVSQLLECVLNLMSKLFSLDLTLWEAWVQIVTDTTLFQSIDEFDSSIDIGKGLIIANFYQFYKANPNETMAAISRQIGISSSTLHGILYNEQEKSIANSEPNFIMCSKKIYFPSLALFAAAKCQLKEHLQLIDDGIESASSLDHELLLAVTTISKVYIDNSDSIERYTSMLSKEDMDKKLIKFQHNMSKSYDMAVLKLIKAAHDHPALWIRIVPSLLDELKYSIPSSIDEKQLILSKLHNEINDKNSLLWITVILCLNVLPPSLLFYENRTFIDVLGVNLLMYFLCANVDVNNRISHGCAILKQFKESLYLS